MTAKAKKFIVAALMFLAGIGSVIAAKRQAFQPGGATTLVSATTSPTSITLNGAGGALLVYNSCAAVVRIETSGGTAATPAPLGSLGVPAATLAVFEIGTTVATVAVKVDSGTACNVELTRGEGMAH